MEAHRTKIVCTIGPSSSSVPMLTRMIQAGMNVARLNFSHGTHEQHRELLKNIRTASKRANRPVAILQDLQGPKIRVGDLPDDGVILEKGMRIHFKTGIEAYDHEEGAIPVTYRQLHKDVKKGHRILLNDGRMEGVVTSVRGQSIYAKVVVAGTLHSRKGINLPDSTISISSFTQKDKADLAFGIDQEVDWVAMSFVTTPTTVRHVRRVMQQACRAKGIVPPKIIVKIERKEAVDRFEEILDVADGIMLARGDLGIELPPEDVPILQKEFIEICRQVGKPIVVATHMMDSMTHNPRATRAETSDVANAVIDHADGVMLSAESATGEYPAVTVKTMAAVIRAAEQSRLDDISFIRLLNVPNVQTSIAQMLHVMAENNQIDLIVSSATQGSAGRMVNVFRPNVPIILACPNKRVARQMMLRAGVYTVAVSDAPATFIHRMEAKLRKDGWIKKRTRVAYVIESAKGEIQITIR